MTKSNREEFLHHRKRADDMGDSMRRYLIGIHAGGIGVLAALVGESGTPPWILCPLFFFSLGLIIVGISIRLQKIKSIRRRDAAWDRKESPNYEENFFMKNDSYDVASFVFFIIGVLFFFAFK